MNFILKNFKRLLFVLGRFILPQNCILLESAPCYCDSVRKICDELLRRNIHKLYKIVWLNFDDSEVPCEYAVICKSICPKKSLLKYLYYQIRARVVICSNLFVVVPGMGKDGKIKSFYISHGSHIKSTHAYYNIPDSFDYLISASEDLKHIQAYESNYPIERVKGLGLPRNDDLLDSTIDVNRLFSTTEAKFIVWYPTFRQGKNGGVSLKGNSCPLIHDEEIAKRINDFAKGKNIYIILKPHFVQDVSFITNNNLSNIILIDDAFFAKNHMTSYQFVGACDALLTDYSSIMYDYTLCGRPIGLIWEDIDDYRINPGFAENIEEYLTCAHKIYNFDDFRNFIEIVASGKDALDTIREIVKKKVNYSISPDNTERVTNFICEQAKIKTK